jgi:hypothetical protein
VAIDDNTNEIVLGLQHGHSLFSESDIGRIIRANHVGTIDGQDIPFVSFARFIIGASDKKFGIHRFGSTGFRSVTTRNWSLPKEESIGYFYIATSNNVGGMLVSLNSLEKSIVFPPTVSFHFSNHIFLLYLFVYLFQYRFLSFENFFSPDYTGVPVASGEIFQLYGADLFPSIPLFSDHLERNNFETNLQIKFKDLLRDIVYDPTEDYFDPRDDVDNFPRESAVGPIIPVVSPAVSLESIVAPVVIQASAVAHAVSLTSVSASVAPVLIPVVAPALTPVVAPVLTPVVAPALTHVVAPVLIPVVAPALTPVVAPVLTPVVAPALTPVVAPVLIPVVAAADQPIISTANIISCLNILELNMFECSSAKDNLCLNFDWLAKSFLRAVLGISDSYRELLLTILGESWSKIVTFGQLYLRRIGMVDDDNRVTLQGGALPRLSLLNEFKSSKVNGMMHEIVVILLILFSARQHRSVWKYRAGVKSALVDVILINLNDNEYDLQSKVRLNFFSHGGNDSDLLQQSSTLGESFSENQLQSSFTHSNVVDLSGEDSSDGGKKKRSCPIMAAAATHNTKRARSEDDSIVGVETTDGEFDSSIVIVGTGSIVDYLEGNIADNNRLQNYLFKSLECRLIEHDLGLTTNTDFQELLENWKTQLQLSSSFRDVRVHGVTLQTGQDFVYQNVFCTSLLHAMLISWNCGIHLLTDTMGSVLERNDDLIILPAAIQELINNGSVTVMVRFSVIYFNCYNFFIWTQTANLIVGEKFANLGERIANKLCGKCLIMSDENTARNYADKIVFHKMTEYCEYIYVDALTANDTNDDILIRFHVTEASAVRETIVASELNIILGSASQEQDVVARQLTDGENIYIFFCGILFFLIGRHWSS